MHHKFSTAYCNTSSYTRAICNHFLICKRERERLRDGGMEVVEETRDLPSRLPSSRGYSPNYFLLNPDKLLLLFPIPVHIFSTFSLFFVCFVCFVLS